MIQNPKHDNTVPEKDIIVTVAHPHDDSEVPLNEWIRHGPGVRPLTALVSARHRETGEPLPMTIVPLQFHNSLESLKRIAAGEYDDPWGRDRSEIKEWVARIDALNRLIEEEQKNYGV